MLVFPSVLTDCMEPKELLDLIVPNEEASLIESLSSEISDPSSDSTDKPRNRGGG